MTQPTPYWRFPNAARTIAKILEPIAGTNKIGTRTPASLTPAVMPYVRVRRLGGPSDQVNDFAYIHIDVLSDNLDAAEQLSERIRQKLTTEKLAYGAVVVDRISCESAPEEMPLWAPGINRFEARYTAVFRRYRAA